MPRPQFSLKSLLWLMAVVAVVFGSTHYGLRWWRRAARLGTYPATGKVMIEGREPAAGWLVTFAYAGSDSLGETAIGTTDERGMFLLKTPAMERVGICPGTYLVSLVPPTRQQCERFARYTNPKTSEITAIVKRDLNVYEFDVRAVK